ncbi:tellurite resistance TerB family protein [Paraglaciecola sp. MB-3u-78]|jgi:uncharacterized membrane protein YebE (DUF533 family)|uniref:tellurite resistance TerB family protein n=1 Tax=Paraglaciecola sp. MB-3u-78 TaxID=2058332 RepID=UPI000C32BDB2|nr:tellurite resistance TerB family protein [Paraglaciecola sp. MB-3u-78]PKG97405.1 DUF533 domain-containing protein [Paraglaciecola sp. MB-3u-78]
MNFQNLLNQFTGSNTSSSSTQHNTKGSSLGSGLMGGAAAGGVMALLVGSKKGRKFAGKAATVGGAALIGGIAFKAYKNWQQNNQQSSTVNTGHNTGYSSQHISAPQSHDSGNQRAVPEVSQDFQLTLIKAMIGAAKSDGHIDEVEQKRIFDAVEQMSLSSEMKGLVFDLLRQPIYVEELAHNTQGMEQKSEVYLASCLAIDLDNASEHNYLNKLAGALGLPLDLADQIKSHAKQALDSERVLN